MGRKGKVSEATKLASMMVSKYHKKDDTYKSYVKASRDIVNIDTSVIQSAISYLSPMIKELERFVYKSDDVFSLDENTQCDLADNLVDFKNLISKFEKERQRRIMGDFNTKLNKHAQYTCVHDCFDKNGNFNGVGGISI